ncbi:polycystin-1-like protein 2 [Montipora foliosa]|uniref:polycystin-1-like protein 2 n=1 Tax=Montipora foliosa TaxID=591990 RepID=UPI0035F2060D
MYHSNERHPDCHKPLGLADGRIKDDQLDASSVYNNNSQLYGPALARLNRTGGYRANPRAHNPFFLSVQFQKAMIVTGIATQGYFDNKIQEWTRRYMLAYLFGSDVKYFKKRNRDDNEQFDGNFDNDTIVRHYVPWPVKLTFIYVIPMEWKNNFAIRMELYGCTAAGNECESFPCQNGTCWQKTGGYQCNCTNGFNGTHCEINIDDCVSNPCKNNGTCRDLVNDFTCSHCLPGYTGKTCEEDINECSSNPCRHNGTCTDYVNSFTCSCPVGFGGSTCDEETGFFLVVGLQLKNMDFTLPLTNQTSPLYQKTEDDVVTEVHNMLFTERDHYFGSALRKFSPIGSNSVVAEVLLRTLVSSTDSVMKIITLRLSNHSGIFDGRYKNFENKANPLCRPPNISLSLSTEIKEPTKIRKSEDFKIIASVTVDCRISFPIRMVYDIDIYAIEINTGTFRSVAKKIGITTGNEFEYTMSAKRFNYGLYYYKISGIIETQIGTSVNKFGYVEVTSSSLVVNIFGDWQVFQGFNKTLTLNGSLSYDPAVGKRDYTGLNFTWLCRRDEETFTNYTELLPVSQPLSRFPSTDDRGGCYGTGVGRVEHRSGVPYILDLNVDRMKGDQGYVIRLVLSKGEKTSSSVHGLRVKEEIHLNISCIHNCERQVIPSFRLILETSCTGPFCSRITKYSWSVDNLTERNLGWQEIQNVEDLLLTERQSPNFVTRPGGLLGNISYLVTVTGETSNGHSSVANYKFNTNSPPVGGRCDVDTPSGEAMRTVFSFECSGWYDEDKPLKYKFLYKSTDGIEMVFQSSFANKASLTLPVGNEKDDYTLQVKIIILDSLGSSVETSVSVKVTDPPVVTVQSLQQDVSVNGPMYQYLKENKIALAAQRATSILSVVNHLELKKTNLKEKRKIKDAIVTAWLAVNVSSLEEVSQVSTVVASLADKRDELSINSQEKAISVMDSVLDFMTQTVKNKSRYSDEKLVTQVGTAVLNGLGNLLDITAYEAKEEISVEDTSLVIITKDRREKSKSYSQKIVGLVTRVGDSIPHIKEPYEKPSVLKTKYLSMAADLQVPSKIADMPLEDQSAKVTLPPFQDLLAVIGKKGEFLSRQLVTFKFNPYTWDKGAASDIKTAVLDFELKDERGNKVDMSNLQQNIELFIPPLIAPKTKAPMSYFVKPSKNGTMQYHKIVFPGPEYEISLKIVPSDNKTLTLYVRYAQRPTREDHNFSALVPDYSSCNRTRENCSSDPFIVTLSEAVTGHSGLHYVGIAYEALYNQTKNNRTAHAKRVRRSCSGNGRQKRSCVGVKDPPTTPPPIVLIRPTFNASADVTYTMEVNVATCQYWNDAINAWSTEGCKVGPKSKPTALQCICNHLSSFGGNFLVAPNPIDFDYVFKEFSNIFESGNVVVLSMVLCIFGLWIVGLMIIRRADRKDEYKAVENLRLHLQGEHLFEVSVYTGMWKGSGTSANVAMIVYGDETQSEVLHLFDMYSEKRLFARASVNNFIISLPDNLHSPVMIKIWHDNWGHNPSWYVSQVVIKDLETEDKWYFICNRWLAVDKEDGEVEIDIPLASKSDLSSFKYKFSTRVTKSLGDGHIWLSVMTRPPQSPFTRAQRLSCCVCVLLCAMLAGAMFYQFGEKDEETIKFGPLRFSLKQIVIGVQSAVVVVPLNLLVVAMFRNVKIAHKNQKQYRNGQEEPDNSVASSKKNMRPLGCLPHFFVYIAWALCIIGSLTAGTFVVFYSVEWGKEIANQWLTSTLVSFLQDVAVIQPIKVVAIALLLALILKKPPEEATAQSATVSVLNPNKNYDVLAPKGEDLITARKTRASIVETISSLVEIVLFLLFVVCVFGVVYGNRGYSRYRFTESLDNIFKKSFEEEVDSKEAFWAWINKVFIPGIYGTTWYNDQPFMAPEGYIESREAFLVGMPRLKQVRVKEEYPCQVAGVNSEIDRFFKRCIPPYSSQEEDKTRFYFPGWIAVNNFSNYNSEYELLRLCPKPWRYNTSRELNTLPFNGRHTFYDGGGYVADLGYNLRKAVRVVQNLESNDWIDQRTAVVFVEFTVFEPSTSLFSMAKFLYEVIPTGMPDTLARFDTLSIYGTSDPTLHSTFVAFQIILLLLIVYFLLLETVKIYRQTCSYFSAFWNWMNLLQVISTITTVVFFFLKEKYVSSFVKNVQANPFETTSTDYVVFWSDLESVVLSVVIFIVTVKLLRIIRFNRHVCQMVASLKLSAPLLVSYSVVFFINILSFSLLGFLLFGNELQSYHSVVASLGTLIQEFLGGHLHFHELRSSNRILGPIYIFSYMFSTGFILINMFLAILNDSYESVKELSGGKFHDAQLGDFIKEYCLTRLKRMQEVLKRRLGSFGYRHELYDRQREASKFKPKGCIGSFTSLPSDYPPYIEHWDSCCYSSQLGLLDNDANGNEIRSAIYQVDSSHVQEEELVEVPCVASSTDPYENTTEELADLLGDLPEATIAPSIASNCCVSSAEFINLLSDLPESMVDDEDTIDKVRKGLANIGAVIRLNKSTLRRFSTTGDKYIVQTNIQIGPTVAVTLRERCDSDKNDITV